MSGFANTPYAAVTEASARRAAAVNAAGSSKPARDANHNTQGVMSRFANTPYAAVAEAALRRAADVDAAATAAATVCHLAPLHGSIALDPAWTAGGGEGGKSMGKLRARPKGELRVYGTDDGKSMGKGKNSYDDYGTEDRKSMEKGKDSYDDYGTEDGKSMGKLRARPKGELRKSMGKSIDRSVDCNSYGDYERKGKTHGKSVIGSGCSSGGCGSGGGGCGGYGAGGLWTATTITAPRPPHRLPRPLPRPLPPQPVRSKRPLPQPLPRPLPPPQPQP